MIIGPAKRTGNVNEYYFSGKLREVASLSASREAEGLPPVINLGIGAPDGMPPASAVAALTGSAVQPGVHAYQSYTGIPELRRAFAGWYRKYYHVELDPKSEIQPLAGSKEGILLISLAFLDEGDRVLVPDPGYPTYSSASRLAGAECVPYDLKQENGWLPDFGTLENSDLKGVKIMWTNYPHMPTGAPASESLYRELADFGRRHGIMICNDNPYSFILNDRPLSILAVPGAKECCLELNSMSKAHNMSGWRIGMVAGASDVISQILKVKSQMDSGMFRPLQLAAAAALGEGDGWFGKLNAEYGVRRMAAGRIMDVIGAEYDHCSTGMFLWGRLSGDNPFAGMAPGTSDSADDVRSLGEKVSDAVLYGAGVFITPGFVFGRNGRDYIRISLCASSEQLDDACSRILHMKGTFGTGMVK